MFDTHMLNDTGKEAMKQYKETLADAARKCLAQMPDSREKSIFVTKMEEASFFGAKAIAALPANHESKTEY